MGSVLVVKILNNHQADRIRLNGIDGPEKGRVSANEPRTPPQSWFMGKKPLSRHAARTSMGAPLPICCDLMAPASITRWSRRLVLVVSKVCAGGYSAGRVGESSRRGQERLVD
jgi:endonuclease YncB( thermonuclease family)